MEDDDYHMSGGESPPPPPLSLGMLGPGSPRLQPPSPSLRPLPYPYEVDAYGNSINFPPPLPPLPDHFNAYGDITHPSLDHSINLSRPLPPPPGGFDVADTSVFFHDAPPQDPLPAYGDIATRSIDPAHPSASGDIFAGYNEFDPLHSRDTEPLLRRSDAPLEWVTFDEATASPPETVLALAARAYKRQNNLAVIEFKANIDKTSDWAVVSQMTKWVAKVGEGADPLERSAAFAAALTAIEVLQRDIHDTTALHTYRTRAMHSIEYRPLTRGELASIKLASAQALVRSSVEMKNAGAVLYFDRVIGLTTAPNTAEQRNEAWKHWVESG